MGAARSVCIISVLRSICSICDWYSGYDSLPFPPLSRKFFWGWLIIHISFHFPPLLLGDHFAIPKYPHRYRSHSLRLRHSSAAPPAPQNRHCIRPARPHFRLLSRHPALFQTQRSNGRAGLHTRLYCNDYSTAKKARMEGLGDLSI